MMLCITAAAYWHSCSTLSLTPRSKRCSEHCRSLLVHVRTLICCACVLHCCTSLHNTYTNNYYYNDTGDEGEEYGVCAPGTELTGRWTVAEHNLFLQV
jgi:hypothetical protein